jgi:hypothetical protein
MAQMRGLPRLRALRQASMKPRRSAAARKFGSEANSPATVAGLLASLPNFLATADLRDFIEACRKARGRGKPLIWAMGAHVIKVGLSPVLIDLMRQGWVDGLAFNGAGIIHDFEIAFAGRTSEDVEDRIRDGRFGMAKETGELLNKAIREGAAEGLGLGQAVGRMIAGSKFPYRRLSLLGTAAELEIPATVHVAIGTDIIHVHPQASGEAIGQTSLRDFFSLAGLVKELDGGGVYLNIGSAVLLPEVFLKAVSLVRNKGHRLDGFSTAVFDFMRHYRPSENVTKRPLGKKGRGYYFVGPHEILIPLLAAALKESKAS